MTGKSTETNPVNFINYVSNGLDSPIQTDYNYTVPMSSNENKMHLFWLIKVSDF